MKLVYLFYDYYKGISVYVYHYIISIYPYTMVFLNGIHSRGIYRIRERGVKGGGAGPVFCIMMDLFIIQKWTGPIGS